MYEVFQRFQAAFTSVTAKYLDRLAPSARTHTLNTFLFPCPILGFYKLPTIAVGSAEAREPRGGSFDQGTGSIIDLVPPPPLSLSLHLPLLGVISAGPSSSMC